MTDIQRESCFRPCAICAHISDGTSKLGQGGLSFISQARGFFPRSSSSQSPLQVDHFRPDNTVCVQWNVAFGYGSWEFFQSRVVAFFPLRFLQYNFFRKLLLSGSTATRRKFFSAAARRRVLGTNYARGRGRRSSLLLFLLSGGGVDVFRTASIFIVAV